MITFVQVAQHACAAATSEPLELASPSHTKFSSRLVDDDDDDEQCDDDDGDDDSLLADLNLLEPKEKLRLKVRLLLAAATCVATPNGNLYFSQRDFLCY